MIHNYLLKITKTIVAIGYYLLIVSPLVVSASVTLAWDPNDPAPQGYNIYQRVEGHDYSTPVNSNGITDTTYTVEDLQPGVTYYFVVRAFSGEDLSGDSNEVQHTEPEVVSDRDGDGVADADDAFPDDPNESVDTDNDGIGNNADLDDDNDGMPDNYESGIEGLDPLVDDADADLDGDNVSNIDEYTNETDPSTITNYVPHRPDVVEPADHATVSLTPDLTTSAFSDANGDSHSQTRYQIALDEGFTDLVFDRVSYEYLTELPLIDLILDPESTYYWRVRFIDNQGGESLWSETSSFTCVNYLDAGDEDANGILDSQQVVDTTVDLDGNQEPDAGQSNLMCVATSDQINSHMSVMSPDAEVQLVGLRSLTTDDIGRGLDVNRPDTLTGLISFKVFLNEGVTTANIIVYFSVEVPEDAAYYYHTEDGWVAYSNAVFSDDRRSVTITLEDGGDGDQDGVRNGVIVDPAGLGYSSRSGGSGSYGASDNASDETSCFINSTRSGLGNNKHFGLAAMFFGIISCGSLVIVCRQRP